MQVLSVRVGMTKNLGNYESAKLEVEASPENGQNIDEFLSEVNNFLGQQVEAAVAAAGGVKEKPAKPAKAKTEAPLKGDDKPATTIIDKSAEPEAEKPKAKSTKSTKADKQAAMKKDAEEPQPETPTIHNPNAPSKEAAREKYKDAMKSETLEELLDRFNSLRTMAAAIGDSWEATVENLKDRYRKINSLDANQETAATLVKAFKAEDQAIEKMKSEKVAA